MIDISAGLESLSVLTNTGAGKIIGGLVSFAGGGIATHFGSRVNENYKRDLKKREAHLTEIKELILDPLINAMRTHFIPIIQFQRSVLATQPVAIRREVSTVTQNAIERHQLQLMIRSHTDGNQNFTWSVVAALNFNFVSETLEELFLDVRNNHFRRTFQRFESTFSELNGFQHAVLEAARAVEIELRSEIHLPEPEEMTSNYWANFSLVAKYIVDRALGIDTQPISKHIAPGAQAVELKAGYDRGLCNLIDSQESEKLIKLMDHHVEKFGRDGILTTALKLRSELPGFLNEFVALRRCEELPKKCSYLWPSK